MGPLRPAPGHLPSYAQLYIYDPQSALDTRCSLNSGLNSRTLALLQSMLIDSNPYVGIFRHAFEFMEREGGNNGHITAHLRATPGCHARRGNLPTADEVAVIICDTSGEEPKTKDIILHHCSGGLSIMNDLHPSYAPLYYVLLFPRGEPGWHSELELIEPDRTEPQWRLSQSRFVAYRLQVRPNEFSTLL